MKSKAHKDGSLGPSRLGQLGLFGKDLELTSTHGATSWFVALSCVSIFNLDSPGAQNVNVDAFAK